MSLMDELAPFEDGARVEVSGHGSWPDGSTGTVRPFPSFVRVMCSDPPHGANDFFVDGLGRRSTGRIGHVVTQWVEFDEPTDDGSGDGPYGGGEILIKHLRRIEE
jgi:hypothetical protein